VTTRDEKRTTTCEGKRIMSIGLDE